MCTECLLILHSIRLVFCWHFFFAAINKHQPCCGLFLNRPSSTAIVESWGLYIASWSIPIVAIDLIGVCLSPSLCRHLFVRIFWKRHCDDLLCFCYLWRRKRRIWIELRSHWNFRRRRVTNLLNRVAVIRVYWIRTGLFPNLDGMQENK